MKQIEVQDQSSGEQPVKVRYNVRGRMTVDISMSLPKELKDKVDAAAKEQRVTRSKLIADLVEKGLE